jgi:hypothetical protein
MDNQQKQQTADRIKQANNILVTVSNNPSVDQLAACIGLTLALNKMDKHATAVFSGMPPSTIEFLQPEKTLEKTTDSLRDFIISLDKAKADKLRYKVEDAVVKIFITPYKTSISDKDLQFSQGDFNVDVVIALGVHSQTELDQAITSHGRILHDATVITANIEAGGELGAINWLDNRSSSLSELAVQLIDVLDKKLLDNQIATALLTGIVAETERFSNDKTSPLTMSYAAELMTAGANQQLVATKLAEKPKPPEPAPEPEPELEPEPAATPEKPEEIPKEEVTPVEPVPEPKKEETNNDGVLEVNHEPEVATSADALAEIPGEEEEKALPEIDINQEGIMSRAKQAAQAAVDATKVADKPQATQAADGGADQTGGGSVDPTSHLGTSRKILPSTGGAQINSVGASEESYNPLTNPENPSATGVPTILQRGNGADDNKSQVANAQANVSQAAPNETTPPAGLNATPLSYELHGNVPGQPAGPNQLPPAGGTTPPPPVSPPPMMPNQ